MKEQNKQDEVKEKETNQTINDENCNEEQINVEVMDTKEGEQSIQSEELEGSIELYENLLEDYQKLQQQFMRSVADYTNLKQRTDRERREYLSQANAQLINKLLPVIDNFERALNAIEDESVASGVMMIYRQLMDLLQAEGLEKIEAAGEQFDPYIHDALMQEQSEDVPDNTVLHVFEPGYRFNNKLLRAAKVKVSCN